MAYVASDLSVLAYANGFTLWHYQTIDNATAVGTAGYFDEAAPMMRTGDVILARLDTDATAPTKPVTGLIAVTGVAAGVVTVSTATTIGS